MSFIPSGAAAAAGGSYQLLAGGTTITGYDRGSGVGAITPDVYKGVDIEEVSTSSAGLRETFAVNANVVETFWTVITITGVFLSGQATHVWERVADGFTYVPGATTTWQNLAGVEDPMISGNTYTVTIN